MTKKEIIQKIKLLMPFIFIKAKGKDYLERSLHKIVVKYEPLIAKAVSQWFNATQKQVKFDTNRIYKAEASDFIDWDQILKDGVAAFQPIVWDIFEDCNDNTNKLLSIQTSYAIDSSITEALVNDVCNKLTKQITDETRLAINNIIERGIREGLSPQEVAEEIKNQIGLNNRQQEAVYNYKREIETISGLTDDMISNRVTRYTNELLEQRADMISRTETARAVNEGSIASYEASGLIKEVEWITADNCCDICAALNHKRFSLAEARRIFPIHPDDRCTFIPVIEGLM